MRAGQRRQGGDASSSSSSNGARCGHVLVLAAETAAAEPSPRSECTGSGGAGGAGPAAWGAGGTGERGRGASSSATRPRRPGRHESPAAASTATTQTRAFKFQRSTFGEPNRTVRGLDYDCDGRWENKSQLVGRRACAPALSALARDGVPHHRQMRPNVDEYAVQRSPRPRMGNTKTPPGPLTASDAPRVVVYCSSHMRTAVPVRASRRRRARLAAPACGASLRPLRGRRPLRALHGARPPPTSSPPSAAPAAGWRKFYTSARRATAWSTPPSATPARRLLRLRRGRWRPATPRHRAVPSRPGPRSAPILLSSPSADAAAPLAEPHLPRRRRDAPAPLVKECTRLSQSAYRSTVQT